MIKKKENVESEVVKPKAQLSALELDLGRADLNSLRDKLNEVIQNLNER